MANPTVKEIVAEYLKNNGYDGLFNADAECACKLPDLCPCTEYDEPCNECVAGYYRNGKSDEDADWFICRDKPGDSEESKDAIQS